MDKVEQKELNFIKYLSNSYNIKTILDIGGNEGEYSELCINHFDNPNIHIFEAIPELANKCTEKFSENNNVIVNNLCVDIEEKIKTFYWLKNCNGMSSLHYRNSVFGNFDVEEIDVKCISLDNYYKENKIIDLVKIDTEGNELNVIKSMKNLLDNGLVKIIQFEIGGCWLDSGINLRMVVDFLPNAYKLCNYVNGNIIELTEREINRQIKHSDLDNYLIMRN